MIKTMINSRNILTLLLAVIFLAACSTNESSETLYKQVQDYHDVAMGKMGALKKGQKVIKGKLDASEEELAEEQRNDLKEKLRKIENADDKMMTWMRQFSTSYDAELPETEKVKILQSELAKIQEIDEEMTAAVEIVESL